MCRSFSLPQIRSEGMIVFALLLLATVALAPQADRFEALLVLVWGFLALRSARHVPFFAIAAAPVLASGAAAYWARLASRAGGRSPLRIFWELAQEFGRRPRVSLWLPLSAAVVMVAAPGVGFPDTVFPVRAVERNLQRLAPAAAMPRILTSDQWADYLIYRLYPATACLLRRAQRFLRSGDRVGLPQAARRREVRGANCWIATSSTWRCCRTTGR